MADRSQPHWHTRAACAGIGPSIFFPAATGVDGRHNGNVTGKAARRVCASCPVVSECVTDGMGESFGIWGGLSPTERLGRRELPRIA
jgi:hypothetical protein